MAHHKVGKVELLPVDGQPQRRQRNLHPGLVVYESGDGPDPCLPCSNHCLASFSASRIAREPDTAAHRLECDPRLQRIVARRCPTAGRLFSGYCGLGWLLDGRFDDPAWLTGNQSVDCPAECIWNPRPD